MRESNPQPACVCTLTLTPVHSRARTHTLTLTRTRTHTQTNKQSSRKHRPAFVHKLEGDVLADDVPVVNEEKHPLAQRDAVRLHKELVELFVELHVVVRADGEPVDFSYICYEKKKAKDSYGHVWTSFWMRK